MRNISDRQDLLDRIIHRRGLSEIYVQDNGQVYGRAPGMTAWHMLGHIDSVEQRLNEEDWFQELQADIAAERAAHMLGME